MRTVDDLAAWLRAQLDDDEESIRTWAGACVHINACDDTGDFLERFDGDRGLAEVDAKRRILDRWEASQDDYLPPDALIALDEIGRLLALPYAARPGYREEWRP